MFLDLGSLSSAGMSALCCHYAAYLHTVLATQYPGDVTCCMPQDGRVLCCTSFCLGQLQDNDSQFMLEIV